MSPWLTDMRIHCFRDVTAAEHLWILTLEPLLPWLCLLGMRTCILICEALQVQLFGLLSLQDDMTC